jgi:hypothetical protein
MINHKRVYVLSSAVWRNLMCSTSSGRLPLYIVTEYPRSGGTWCGQLLSESLQIPFPRQTAPRYESCVMQGHYLYSPRFKNVTCVVRDGRDCMISLYYQLLFNNDRNDPRSVAKWRKRLSYADFNDIGGNLANFIERTFEIERKSPSPYRFTWSRWVDSWHGHSVFVRYEALLRDTNAELMRALGALGVHATKADVTRSVEKFEFQALTGRRPGQQDTGSVIRNGVAGAWRNMFSDDAKKVFSELAGDQLVALGYESDNAWALRGPT